MKLLLQDLPHQWSVGEIYTTCTFNFEHHLLLENSMGIGIWNVSMPLVVNVLLLAWIYSWGYELLYGVTFGKYSYPGTQWGLKISPISSFNGKYPMTMLQSVLPGPLPCVCPLLSFSALYGCIWHQYTFYLWVLREWGTYGGGSISGHYLCLCSNSWLSSGIFLFFSFPVI